MPLLNEVVLLPLSARELPPVTAKDYFQSNILKWYKSLILHFPIGSLRDNKCFLLMG